MPEISGIIQNYLEGQISTIGRAPVIQSKNITENGTYTAPEGVDGFSPVVVNVPDSPAVIDSISIFGNGTYTAPEGIDGYSPIVVDVPQKIETTLNATSNGTYTPSEGYVYNSAIVNVPTYTPIRELYYKPFVESDMRLTTGLSGDIKSEWVGNSSIGCTIQGTVDLRNYHSVTVKGTITDSYEYTNKTGYDRCQFVCGFTDQVFNSIILVNYNTGDHIVESEMRTLTNEQTATFTINFDLDEITGDHLYFFISMLGISGNFETEVR